LSHISSKEISEWMAYNRIEPFGEERADIRSAIIACTLANVYRGKDKPPFKIDDFIPTFKKQEPMDWQDIKGVLKGMCNG